MNVALVVIGDRGDLYLPAMLESLERHVPYGWSARIVVDDSDHRLGMAGAVNAAWDQLPADTDYVFHVEEDFLFTRHVPVGAMARTLQCNPRLAQLVLKRPAWSAEERAAGGIVELHPGEYVDKPGWLEHRRIFSMNPCVYPAAITRDGYPAGNEAGFTEQLLERDFVFGIWGSRAGDPYCVHVGAQRGSGWRL